MPRFQPDVFDENLKLVHEVEKIASKKNVTPAQVATGWVVAQSRRSGLGDIIPIPGASSAGRVEENSAPAKLSEEETEVLAEILKKFAPVGERYPEAIMALSDA